MGKIVNALTIDLEDWFHHLPENKWKSKKRRIPEYINFLLDQLGMFNYKATFFVLGDVAKNHKEEIKKISKNGHYIASHNLTHSLIYKQSIDDFTRELKLSKNMLEDITGKEVKGFRAPYFSITKKTLWALDLIKEAGYVYDSSIFPLNTPLYGIRSSSSEPYYHNNGLFEVPLSVLTSSLIKIPISGGFYLRVIPYGIYKKLISSYQTKKGPVVIYYHPWEQDTHKPFLFSFNPVMLMVLNYGTKRFKYKIDRLFSDFVFAPIEEVFSKKCPALLERI